MIRKATIPLATLAVLAACGPMSPERAADLCADEARKAAGPTGEIGIGVNSGGDVTNRIEIGISSDFLLGKDPQLVYEDCVRRKTGQAPIRPLVL